MLRAFFCSKRLFSSENHVEIRDFCICMIDNFVLQKLYCVMNEIIEDAYDFELTVSDESKIQYHFISRGKKDIIKRVEFVSYSDFGLAQVYNLGFGNLVLNEHGEEVISDLTRDNNKDNQKVLNTVFSCALNFLNSHPTVFLTFYGNTTAKHRLYKIQMASKFNAIKECFSIKGGVIPNLQTDENEADGKIVVSEIDFTSIEVSDYLPEESSSYNFFVFELTSDLKKNKFNNSN